MTALCERAVLSRHSVPSLPRHVRIQYGPLRQALTVLSPEKISWPNEIRLEILRRCDSRSNIQKIIADLAREYVAPEEAVAADVTAFIQECSDKLPVKL